MNIIDKRIYNITEELYKLNQSYQGTIEELKWQISEIDKSRNIWYNKCMEYENILHKIGYFKTDNLPF